MAFSSIICLSIHFQPPEIEGCPQPSGSPSGVHLPCLLQHRSAVTFSPRFHDLATGHKLVRLMLCRLVLHTLSLFCKQLLLPDGGDARNSMNGLLVSREYGVVLDVDVSMAEYGTAHRGGCTTTIECRAHSACYDDWRLRLDDCPTPCQHMTLSYYYSSQTYYAA